MSETKIYYNAQCSKSQNALSVLKENGIEPEIVEYLTETPSISELDELCLALALEPLDIIRSKEAAFQELGLSIEDERSREDWLYLMVKNPVLIQRPIVVHQGNAVVARTSEAILGVL